MASLWLRGGDESDTMRMSQAILMFLFIAWTPVAGHGQAAPVAASPAAQADAQPQPPPSPAVSATSILQPALTQTQAMLAGLKVERWKKGSVRDEAEQNVSALMHDLQANMPPLLTAADAEPNTLSHAIPLMKHLDAFYDVLLRVEEASRVSAPGDQVQALQQTLLDLNKARNSYDDQLQTQAAGQEKMVVDLQGALRTQKDAVAAAQAKAASVKEAPCKPATPAKKKRKTTSAGTASPSGSAPGSSSGTKPPAATPKPQ